MSNPQYPAGGEPERSGQPGGDPRPGMFGTPEHDIQQWDGAQSFSDTCAIRCQEFLIELYTGTEIEETELVRQAMQLGVYQPGGGTPPQAMGALLEAHGIDTNVTMGASIADLARELAQGHKVMVGVDADELWNNRDGNPIFSALYELQDMLGFAQANHAVVVSGIDTSDPSRPQVVISDPGTGEPLALYPLEQFLYAWRDSGFHMVSTTEPAPSHLPEMANFPYDEGHIPTVAGYPYDIAINCEDNLPAVTFDDLVLHHLNVEGIEVPGVPHASPAEVSEVVHGAFEVDTVQELGEPLEPDLDGGVELIDGFTLDELAGPDDHHTAPDEGLDD